MTFEEIKKDLVRKIEEFTLKEDSTDTVKIVAEFAAYTQKSIKTLRAIFPRKPDGVIKGYENREEFEVQKKELQAIWWHICEPLFSKNDGTP